MTIETALAAVKAAEKHYLDVYYGPSIQAVSDASDALDVANANLEKALIAAEFATEV